MSGVTDAQRLYWELLVLVDAIDRTRLEPGKMVRSARAGAKKLLKELSEELGEDPTYPEEEL